MIKKFLFFFIGNLNVGGKERRLIELLTWLAGTGRYELMVVVTDPQVHYAGFYDLNITYRIIEKKRKKRSLRFLPIL